MRRRFVLFVSAAAVAVTAAGAMTQENTEQPHETQVVIKAQSPYFVAQF